MVENGNHIIQTRLSCVIYFLNTNTNESDKLEIKFQRQVYKALKTCSEKQFSSFDFKFAFVNKTSRVTSKRVS